MTSRAPGPMLMQEPLLMLLDGHAIVHRAWHAIREPMNVQSTGEEVRAVYGFLNTLLRNLSEWRPTHCAIAFDLPAPTFRHLEFKEYKAQRPPTPPELLSQFDRIRQVVEAFEIPIFEIEGFEADDVLGTLCRQAEEQQLQTLILTGDTDTLQLVSPWVRVLLSFSVQRRMLYDEAAVRERYGGLEPPTVADVKALQGDSSDNIPGVPSVGAKTAIRLLVQFGSVEGIYENIDAVTPPRTQQNLRDNREVAFRDKSLTTIVRDVPVKLDLETARYGTYQRAQVIGLLRDLEFYSMVDRVPDLLGDGGEPATDGPAGEKHLETDYTVVDNVEALEEMIGELDSPEGFSFDTETTSLNPMDAGLVGLSFSNAPGRAWYVPVGHDEGAQLPLEQVLDRIRALMEAETVPKSAHNANFDMSVLASHGIQVRNLAFDTMVAAHLCGRNIVGLKALALELLGVEMTPITDLIGTGRKQITMAQVPVDRAAPYAAADADMTLRIQELLAREVDEKELNGAFETTELPLIPVLVRMQRNGVRLDSDMLGRMSFELGNELTRIVSDMYDVVGHQFNLNSSQQLSDVLFKELRLPPTRRMQKGHSTDASSLDSLKQLMNRGEAEGADPRAQQVLDNILEYRQLSKIKSTYVDALPLLVNTKTGRVHTSYNQTGAATGRVSSNDPNVQNIPVRTELGRQVRKAFVAEKAPEFTLLAADYSQIELRVLAHLSEDPGLLEAFRKGEDIHSATASSVYGVSIDGVIPDMRRIAKIMNFGVIYGLSAFGISQQTGLSREEGRQFIETYFGRYPGIREYIDQVKAQVKERGYVETMMGRRRYIPEIRSSNFNVRAASERMAINMPIQGTAADLIKIAMVRIQERLDALKLHTMMIIQVHDELIFEVPVNELEQVKAIVLELMPSAMSLTVPLAVELKAGATWGDME